jgi:mersacidin/lichenicidin family type 2 lantibiotic
MNNLDVIRAWRDEEYRLGLSEAERVVLPRHPAGLIELEEADLAEIAGGIPTPITITIPITVTIASRALTVSGAKAESNQPVNHRS